MTKIIRLLTPHWKAVLAVLGLLTVTLWGAGGLGYAYFPRLTVLPPAPLGWAGSGGEQ